MIYYYITRDPWLWKAAMGNTLRGLLTNDTVVAVRLQFPTGTAAEHYGWPSANAKPQRKAPTNIQMVN